MRYYIGAFKKFAVTTGRASRKELWFYVLFDALAILILSFFDGLLGVYLFDANDWGFFQLFFLLVLRFFDGGILYFIYLLVTACPWICLCMRRLHDLGKKGSYYWNLIIPIFNLYVLYLLYFKAGDPGENQYGPPPFVSTIQEDPQPTASSFEPVQVVQPQQPVAHLPSNQVEHTKAQTCHKCGTTLSSNSLFCGNCGTFLSSQTDIHQTRFCRKCGKELVAGSKFCNKCGTAVWKENKS